MSPRRYLQNALIGATAALAVGGRIVPGNDAPGPVMSAAAAFVRANASAAYAAVTDDDAEVLTTQITAALDAFTDVVSPLSHPRALEDAFRGYFAYRAAHPNVVRKPYLYFVDYGLPSTSPRGWVLDMDARKIVEGPFAVAHGRGSSQTRYGVPRRFSNAVGSAASSLGLFVAQETYAFRGNSGGNSYRSLGLRLSGVSGRYNDNARTRGVVAHGAPYVTATKAGRSEGWPAMEQSRARRLLPKLANGGLVFLFAPDSTWIERDPWVAAGSE
jgi:hypothetical protein